MRWIKHQALVFFLLFIVFTTEAQQLNVLSLDDAQQKARANYPAIRQLGLLKETEHLSIANLNKGYLPQVSINGQVSYQSEVTEVKIPIPGITIEPLSKDQYKFTADLTQVIFDGGVISRQKKLQKLNTGVEDQKVEVELYKLRETINQVYLNILYLGEQIKQADLVKQDLETGVAKIKAQVENGVAFRSNLDMMKAELLKADQRSVELIASREGLFKTLGLFLNAPIDSNTRLELPAAPISSNRMSRPEIKLYNSQDSLLSGQKRLILSRNLPKASLFGQGGYGRPGLNMLNNRFDWFYLTGVRLSWPLSGFYTYKNERKLIELNKRSVDLQKETFLLNTSTQMQQQAAEIEKFRKLVDTDEEIIALREKVKNAAKAQLENGVITANDYLREVNAEDQAKQARIAHHIQLIQAQINYRYLTGD